MDARGGTAITRELFCDAMFEVADLYTESSSSGEYAAFLTGLLASCTQRQAAADATVFWQCSEVSPRRRAPLLAVDARHSQRFPRVHCCNVITNATFPGTACRCDCPAATCASPLAAESRAMGRARCTLRADGQGRTP